MHRDQRVAQLVDPLAFVVAHESHAPRERVGATARDARADERVEHLPFRHAEPCHDRHRERREHAAFGLTIGTRVEPRQVPLIFSLLVIPMTFLGAVYYPWINLTPLPWLKVAVLVNPLIYMSEGMRVALTSGVPHMAVPVIYVALAGFTVVFLKLGIDGFKKRVLS